MATFSFDFNVSIYLNETEIWLDGCPENPTIEDVRKVLQKECRNVSVEPGKIEIYDSDEALRLVKDWSLHDGTYLTIRKL